MATAQWALDSGGFSELSLHGRWTIGAPQYVAEVRRYADEIGRLEWASAQDWMCEPAIVANTGLSIERHQRLTTENYLELTQLAPDLPFVPVVQGWAEADYVRHVEQYAAAGVDLQQLPLVGLGSVCRRQHTNAAVGIIGRLVGMGLRLHGFGFKTLGLRRASGRLASADSMAWSLRARYAPPLPGCHHRACNNCLRYALAWREAVLRDLAGPD